MKLFPHLLLASKSPRRHELLRGAGFEFTIVNIDAEESYPDTLTKAEVCEYLANKKAAHFTESINTNLLVTADTIVCLEQEVINKPTDFDDAYRMLTKLSGKMHEVYTGVCIKNDLKSVIFSEKTEVFFHELTESEIVHYIETYKPYDKAGAYGVQDWMGYVGEKK